jgi:prophage tail gpP-like protein
MRGMTSLLTPACTVRTGSQEWTKQVLYVRVSLEAGPRIDTVSIIFPAFAPLDAAPGDDVVVSLDSGEQDDTVFTGIVDRIRRTPSVTIVNAINAGGVLARTRPSVTFDHITGGGVVRQLCSEAAVDPGDIDAGVSLPYYVADPDRTAWQHITRLAAWGGAIVTVSSDNAVNAVVVDAQQADLALRYGREILDFSFDEDASHIDTFSTAGETGVGAADASLCTSTGACGRVNAFLQPKIRPGSIIELHDMPSGIPQQPLWVRRVEHALSADGATTRIDVAWGGESFDPTALLGSLGGAIGALR